MRPILNSAQKEAVYHGNGPCLIIAGPGSGKTTVLLKRIKFLLGEKKINSEKILVLTFSKAASLEMKARFEKNYSSVEPVQFATFHSFCYHLLQQSPKYRNLKIITEQEALELMKETVSIASDTFLPGEESESLLQEISRFSSFGVELQNYQPRGFEQEEFKKIVQTYKRIKQEHGVIDFDDMLQIAYLLLKNNPNILSFWRNQYDTFLLDEVQDMNLLQYRLIFLLSYPNYSIFAVGDDDQSIYGFRGASPSYMEEFSKKIAQCKVIYMTQNYRCPHCIVEQANRLIANNKHRFEKELKGLQEKQGEVLQKELKDEKEEAYWVIKLIKDAIKQGTSLENIVVLYRNHHQGNLLKSMLIQQGIPVKIIGEKKGKHKNWVIEDILHFLRFVLYKSVEDLICIMNRPNRYLSRESVLYKEFSEENWKAFYQDRLWLQQRVIKFCDEIHKISFSIPLIALQRIKKNLEYQQYIKERIKKSPNEKDEISKQWNIIEQTAKKSKNLWEWMDLLEDCLEQEKEDMVEGICFMTLHGAKGLEYDIVFILDCNEGILPSSQSKTESQLEEERRLFYVGMTRAKQKLYLCYTQQYQNKKYSPSRFLGEIKMENT